MEEFQSKIGRIVVQTMPYCEGCRDFYPCIHKNILTGDGGKVLYNEEGDFVTNGVAIRCDNMFRCQGMYRDLKERIKEATDGTAQTQPDGNCCEERGAAAEETSDV